MRLSLVATFVAIADKNIGQLSILSVRNDSGLKTGLFNTKLHLEILHQDYIA